MLCVAFCYIIAILLGFNDRLGAYIDITHYTIPAFGLLSLTTYFILEHLKKQKNNAVMLNMVLVNTMSKLLLSVSIVVLYYKLKSPDDGIFVVPFIIIYVIFTVFETYYMSEQARTKR